MWGFRNTLSLEDDDEVVGKEATIWGIISQFEPVCEWQLVTYLSIV